MAVSDTKKQNLLSNKWFLPLSVAIICFVTISLYDKSIKNDYLDLDDMTIIVRNYNFIKDFSNAGQAFKQGVFQVQGETDTLTSYYRPMVTLSFMADSYISPKKSEYPIPAPYIRDNIFYHVVACILLLFLLLQLKIPPLPSLALSLIFAVHPLLNQAVAWIPGRNDSLLTIFILASFIFLLRYLKTKKTWLITLHIFFFLLALFTKENAVMFIPVLFIYLRFIQKEKIAVKTYLALGITYVLCILPWLVMRHIALATNADRSTLSAVIKTMASNSPFFILYISKSILPFNLSVMSVAADTNYFTGLLAIALLLAGILLSRQKNLHLIIFGITWFLLFLAPSFFSSFSGLEHRAYLPLLGVFLVVSQFDIIKQADFNDKSSSSKLGIALLGFIFLLFFATSFKRLSIFENRYAFDQSAMEGSPTALLPCLYLAAHYEQEKMYDKAIDAYSQGLARDSTYDLTYLNMAGDYIRLKNFKEAEKILRLDIRRSPNNSLTNFNLGLVVFQGDTNYSEGVRLWKKSIALDSNFAQPYKVLSQYYQALGDSSNAILYRNFYLKKRVQ